jgi:maltose/moltooligosaccharide transporter
MSFGFLGIQFGWALQMANMSAIYEYLGARADQIPMLWLAAPLTGLVVQPFIGAMSDRTWGPLGRRRPYFLVGALLSSGALLLMPRSSSLWMAAGLLWILDASINVSMEPFRAFVADLLPPEQRTIGFAMQSFFIGLGAVVASGLPYLLRRVLPASPAGSSRIPETVRLSFEAGAVAFLVAVLYTIATTREYPPEGRLEASEGRLRVGHVDEILSALREMPETMARLAWVQIATWLGLFCMWLYFPVAVAHNVFGAASERAPAYQDGIEWGGICFGFYSAVCFAFSFALPALAKRLGRRATHTICLLCGAAGLASVALIRSPAWLLAPMAGVGIAWASILAMPYAILAGSLPEERTGVYMGIFNFFIVIPEIVASLGFGYVMGHVLGNDRMAAVVVGGGLLVLAAVLMQRVPDEGPETMRAVAKAA